jgi:hypothetical protein
MMNWGAYAGLFGFSTFKFMFAPLGGPLAHLTFIETYCSCVAGAIFSAAIFYFSSEYFLIRAHKKRVAAIEAAKLKGLVLPSKKKFTRTNKTIVRLKRRFGIYGISMYAPFFFSVPIGSIITAKFYGKDKRTFPIMIFGMFFNGALTTSLTYLVT